jgi:hypothetical protein
VFSRGLATRASGSPDHPRGASDVGEADPIKGGGRSGGCWVHTERHGRAGECAGYAVDSVASGPPRPSFASAITRTMVWALSETSPARPFLRFRHGPRPELSYWS